MSTCNVFLSADRSKWSFQLRSIIMHLNPQQEAGPAWQKMSPVTLDDNCTKMKAAEAEALLSYSALIFSVTALEMHMQDEGLLQMAPRMQNETVT